MHTTNAWDVVLKVLNNEQCGVLGTTHLGHAYASLVAFAVNDDAHELYFATTRATRKYHNISEDEQVSFLVDNRANQTMPLYEAVAVTAYGQAVEVDLKLEPNIEALYLDRHPQMRRFVEAPSAVLFRIIVENYHLVQRFQNVTEFRIIE